MAAIGAWKRAYLQNKAAPFSLVAFVGAPLTQTIYGMILRNSIQAAKYDGDRCDRDSSDICHGFYNDRFAKEVSDFFT